MRAFLSQSLPLADFPRETLPSTPQAMQQRRLKVPTAKTMGTFLIHATTERILSRGPDLKGEILLPALPGQREEQVHDVEAAKCDTIQRVRPMGHFG